MGITTFPGFPGMNIQDLVAPDYTTIIRVIRKTGYMFLYMDQVYVGQFAYANAITNVDIIAAWRTNEFTVEKWVEYFKVWPKEALVAPV